MESRGLKVSRKLETQTSDEISQRRFDKFRGTRYYISISCTRGLTGARRLHSRLNSTDFGGGMLFDKRNRFASFRKFPTYSPPEPFHSALIRLPRINPKTEILPRVKYTNSVAFGHRIVLLYHSQSLTASLGCQLTCLRIPIQKMW